MTGASGLLGRQVMEAFADGAWEVRGLRRTRGGPPLVVCDLTVEGAAALQIADFKPHLVVHLAVERRPEALRRCPAGARSLNVDATKAIVTACQATGVSLLYVSCDSVFDGLAPPYSVDSMPNPLTEHGWHKLHAEKMVLSSTNRTVILRVPMLYGPMATSLMESEVTAPLAQLQRTGNIVEADDWTCCYPTSTVEVAAVLRSLADLSQGDESVRGIFHWQGEERLTRYGMLRAVADYLGVDPSRIKPSSAPPQLSAVPKDARLDCSRILSLFAVAGRTIPRHLPFAGCIKPYLSPFGVGSSKGGVESSWQFDDRSQATAGIRDEIRAQGAALQELFLEQLEKTRTRLRAAGYLDSPPDAHLRRTPQEPSGVLLVRGS